MNELLKKRISAINSGIIPKGYKKTKVGIVPVEWEEKRIENICEMKSGNTITAKKFDDSGEYPCYGGNGLRGFTNSFTHHGKYVIIGRQGALCGNVKLVNGCFFASEHAIVVTNTNSNCDYTYYLLDYMNLNRYSESSAQPGLSVEKILRLKILLPPLPEQQKIAEILSTQDKLIELYERKIEQLKTLKKGYLQKMFPKKGCKYPELRFKGFTDDWEQRKVGDIADRYDNLRVPVAANLRIHGDTPYYGANGIQDYVAGYTHEGEFVLVAEDGANDLKNYPVQCVKGRIWVNNHAHVIQGKADVSDNRFLSYTLHRTDIESLLVGGGRAKLNAEILMGIILQLPSLQEQQQIGHFFQNVDNLITLHQHKLDKEKQKKKALMQLLLTGKVRVST